MRQRDFDRPRKTKRNVIIFLVLLLVLALAGIIFLTLFHVKTVEVTGSEQYTEEEIRDLVLNDKYSDNSLYVYLKYRYGEPVSIPFIDKLEVTLKSPGHMKIRVYEKSLVGYVEYLGANLYFDKDGIVVENSSELIEDVPRITGLQFNALTLYKPLQVQDKEIFQDIVEITQLMVKYDLEPDQIEFRDKKELMLYFGDVRVLLNRDGVMDDKAATIQKLLPMLEGKAGTLHLEEGIDLISFKLDEIQPEPEPEEGEEE